MTIQKIYLPRICLDSELKPMTGEFLGDEWILHEIDFDCDIFDIDTGHKILSFRKRRLKGFEENFRHFKRLAKPSRGRGAPAGPIDPNSPYWKTRKLVNTNGIRTGYLKKDGTPSKMLVNNHVLSSAIGYVDAIRGNLGVNLPCRLSSYTTSSLKSYEKSIPYMQQISRWYRKTHPEAYQSQMDRAMLKPQYRIANTPFSSCTVNRTFRTALHKDSGDFGGVACLTVLEHGLYNGGLFMLPAFGIGVNIRSGDILVANVHEYHSNSEIWTTDAQDLHNATLEKQFKDTLVGTVGTGLDYSRISMVLYLREKMSECV